MNGPLPVHQRQEGREVRENPAIMGGSSSNIYTRKEIQGTLLQQVNSEYTLTAWNNTNKNCRGSFIICVLANPLNSQLGTILIFKLMSGITIYHIAEMTHRISCLCTF